ncbi:hypothetical protein F0U59_26755 [Archangium gephyra]|nr:hypothetical protein F0U59_26755 [Archangium gephyra]
MMNEITPYKNGRKKLLAGADAAMELGDMKVAPGVITYGHVLTIELIVEASANTAALTATQIDSVLNALKYYFKPSHCLKAKIETYQNESLLALRSECRRHLRRDYRDVDDATTGLKKAFTTGFNTLTFMVYIPFAFSAHVKQASKVMGLGRVQMLDSSAYLKVEGDAFKAVSSNLTLRESYVNFAPLWTRGHERFIGIPMMSRKLVAPGRGSIVTESGLVLSVEQEKPLGATALEKLTVTVGGIPVTREQPPEVIQRAYEEGDGFAPVEDVIQVYRTPLYVPAGNTDFAQLMTGAVEVEQAALIEEWAVRAVWFPYLTTQQIFDLVTREADDLAPGKQLLAVNAAAYDGVDANEAQLPFSGFVIFTSDESGFYEHAGIRCAKGGLPEVYIPPHISRLAARRIIDAMTPSELFPQGDQGAANGVEEEVAWRVPGLVVNEAGLEYVSTVASEVGKRLKAAVAEQEQKTRQNEAFVTQLRTLAGSKGGTAPASTPPSTTGPTQGRAPVR